MGEIGEKLHQNQNILRVRTESGLEEVYYPIFYEGLPKEYELLAEQELGETSTEQENGLRILKEFVRKENLSATDDVLITVLRACKYDYKKSKSKLKRYLKLHRTLIQQLCEMSDKEIESILDVSPFGVLPYRDKHGRAIFTTEPPRCLDKYPLEVIEPVAYALVLYTMEFPLSIVSGMSILCETKNCPLKVLYPVLRGFRKYIRYMHDLPLRYGRTDICNEVVLCRIFFNAVRGFLPEKFSERIQFHGDSYKSVHSVYHPNILPSEFEGNLGPKDGKFYRARLVDFIRKLREEYREENF